ncbi:OsmC family protein [Phenylobacterium sp.]|jgi:organic hydroperoxide reductase OsmC/OhrA|uniref:OsmC family protein n=1 Tax=Phenylobacterium sp. TaxID=1871053 RepID=UPI002F40424B
MPRHTASVAWALGGGEDFVRGRYSRAHTVAFDSGLSVPGSASPHVVPGPWSVEAAVDPEEMLVAALAACHMLSFLHVAREAGFVVTAYRDEAEGAMEKTADGRWWVARVALRPAVDYAGPAPGAAAAAALHHAAHQTCFIANSVRTEVIVEPCR